MKKLFAIALLLLSTKVMAAGPFIGYVQISTGPGVKQSGGFNVGRSTVTAMCFDDGSCQTSAGSGGGPITGTYFATPTNGDILDDKADLTGTNIFLGPTATPSGSVGTQNACLGAQTCTTATGSFNNNTMVGALAGRNTLSGNNNTAVGNQALGGLDTSGGGDRTTAIGANALSADGTPHECTAVGWNAGGGVIGCNSNDFFGFDAGNTSGLVVMGGANECIGAGTCGQLTLGNSNTCVGQNTAIGSLFNGSACSGISTGSFDTMIGAGAASQNSVNESSCTYVGALSGSSGSLGSKLVDAIAIGYRAIVISSNTAQIGASAGVDSVILHVSSGSIDSGFFQLGSKTAAQIRALTPATNPVTGLATGEQYYCSDCSTVGVCVSTGTAAGAWALITNKGSACN